LDKEWSVFMFMMCVSESIDMLQRFSYLNMERAAWAMFLCFLFLYREY